MLSKIMEIFLVGGYIMPNIRKEPMKKYGVNPNRFMELYYFCLQYNDWKEELQSITDIDKKKELQKKCELVERTAIEADENLYSYILCAVTNKGVTYRHLQTVYNIPCSKDMYYNRRKKFYSLLSLKRK